MNTEYLIAFESEKNLCSSPKQFKNLLSIHNDIKIEGNKIKFQDKTFKYTLKNGKLPNNSDYYNLNIELTKIEDENEFDRLLKEIRNICFKISNKDVVELGDAISEYYCQKGYSIVYRTEMLMRKLIYKFMTISVGYEWKDESTPKEVLHSIRDQKGEINFLYEVDFIKLSDFLFKNISKTDTSELIKLIKDASPNDEKLLDNLKSKLPYSNWERFFSKRLNCDSNLLKTKWENLYKLRCMIAHSKKFTKDNYKMLEKLSNEICKILESALQSINEINVEDKDRDEISENITSFIGNNAYKFIELYNILKMHVQDIIALNSENPPQNLNKPLMVNILYLYKNEHILPINIIEKLKDICGFRNNLIHQSGINEIDETEIIEKIKEINNIIKYISNIKTID